MPEPPGYVIHASYVGPDKRKNLEKRKAYDLVDALFADRGIHGHDIMVYFKTKDTKEAYLKIIENFTKANPSERYDSGLFAKYAINQLAAAERFSRAMDKSRAFGDGFGSAWTN